MRGKKSLLIILLLLVLSVPGYTNSLLGTRGLTYIPTADTQHPGRYGANFMMINTEGNLGINVGIWDNFELFANFNSTESFSQETMGLGVKVRVLRETRTVPSLAVGMRNKEGFIVASKIMDYRTTIRGHVGVGRGFGLTETDVEVFDGIFFGFNKLYNPVRITTNNSRFQMPTTNVKLEYINNKISIGADIYLNQYFILNLGTENFSKVTYGISYSNYF